MTPPATAEDSPTPPRASSLADFGNRRLDPTSMDVYAHNAWDGVAMSAEQVVQAQARVAVQQAAPAPPERRQDCRDHAAQHWDRFYTEHENRFFKDRHWFPVEFPELQELDRRAGEVGCATCAAGVAGDAVGADAASPDETPKDADARPLHDLPTRPVVWEVGCGAGNTIFPLLRQTDHLFVYGCDLSAVAVDVVRASPEYEERRCHAFVYDITAPTPPAPIAPHSVDIITCVFVLSAIPPDQWPVVVRNLTWALKPGGLLLFRDYGRHDLAQLRFKAGRYLQENFYCRGDGTQVYFFSLAELEGLFGPPTFAILQNAEDRRLLVNRSKQLQMWVVHALLACVCLGCIYMCSSLRFVGMGSWREDRYRVWVQGKYRKLPQFRTSGLGEDAPSS